MSTERGALVKNTTIVPPLVLKKKKFKAAQVGVSTEGAVRIS